MQNIFKYIQISLITLAVLFAANQSIAQQQTENYKIACIAFYNLENLFDTIDSENTRDTEFTPEGRSNWDTEKYLTKLDNLAKVIVGIGVDFTPDGAAIIGVSENENKQVLIDLVNHPTLKERNYGIVHYDSPDRRGVDVGLLYSKKYFEVTSSSSHRLHKEGDTNFRTRDQLLVSGILDGEEMHFIVNHWPSRRGGEKRSRPLRNAAADLSRSIIDSLLKINPDAKIALMGDLNDDPVDPSVKHHLRAKGSIENMGKDDLFNPMYALYKRGIGSLAWRDSWNLFDQVIVSRGFTGNDYSSYRFYRAKIHNMPYMQQQSGAFRGYPYRSFAGGSYLGGYSDHFPVYIYIIKKSD